MSFFNRAKVAVVGACSGVLASAGMAMADPDPGIDLSGLEPDYSSLGPVALALGGALMAMWGIKKVFQIIKGS